MSPTTAAELSLINDTEFLEELEEFQQTDEHVVSEPRPQRGYGDAFDALETGLADDAYAAEASGEVHEFVPVDDPYPDDVAAGPPAPAQNGVPMIAAALVIVACLAAGAVSAAVVFHDRLARVTATR